MKILHLFSDWKWTGPAEPTVSLCEALHAEGADVTIAYRKAPAGFPERTVEKEVERRDIPRFDGLRLNRYFSLKDWAFDLRAIREYVRDHHIDILHANLSHDHFAALLSMGFFGKRPLVVRTDHKRDGMPGSPFMGWAVGKTDAIVTYSQRILEQDMSRFSIPRERMCLIPPGVVPYKGPVRDMRSELGITGEEKVIGVIGRLKPDRGFDVILKAFRLLRDRMDGVKLVIVGRSSQIEKSIIQPVAQLGLGQDVILAGYRTADYFDVIVAFDVFVMMRAGSDGTARALREVVAIGKPVIVSNLGMLPELVDEGKTGFVVPPDPDALAEKMMLLLGDDDLRRRFGTEALRMAEERWDFRSQARQMMECYKALSAMGKR